MCFLSDPFLPHAPVIDASGTAGAAWIGTVQSEIRHRCTALVGHPGYTSQSNASQTTWERKRPVRLVADRPRSPIPGA